MRLGVDCDSDLKERVFGGGQEEEGGCRGEDDRGAGGGSGGGEVDGVTHQHP